MAEISEYLYELKPLSEMDMNMEELKQLPQQNPSLSESFSASDFSVDSLLSYQLQTHQQQQQQDPEFSGSYYSYINDHRSSTFCSDMILSSSPMFNTKMGSNQIGFPENKKRKTVERLSNFFSPKNISSLSASTDNTNEKNEVRICKKGKSKDKESKAEEVIHVRAKRGQATDSHSIAERVRREKINKKLRCLQDLVPGCHKSMVMAVMLEEIINYVHSLQNQVEFLSMELAAASNSYGLNLESSRKHQVMDRKCRNGGDKDLESLIASSLPGPFDFQYIIFFSPPLPT